MSEPTGRDTMSEEAIRLLQELSDAICEIDGRMTDRADFAQSALESYIERIERERAEYRNDALGCTSRIAALEAENERMRALLPLARYGWWALDSHREYNGDLDGGDLQEKAEALGLLAEVEIAEPCCDDCVCVEYYGSDDFPVKCMRYTDAANALRAIDAARGK